MRRTTNPYPPTYYRNEWEEDFWGDPVATTYVDTLSTGFVDGKVQDNPWKYYFLYGTLKTGHRNHFLIDRANAEFNGHMSIDGYGLGLIYDCVPSAFKHTGFTLQGELWRIREPNIHLIDALESGYNKETIELARYAGIADTATLFVWSNKDEVNPLGVTNWSAEIERTYLE